jgi:hypothetical protein
MLPSDASAREASLVPQIQVVLNWFEDLKQRMSVR